MTLLGLLGYYRSVPALRSGARRGIAAGALLFTVVSGWPRAAVAATTSFEVRDQSVVQVIGRNARVTIRTWARDTVQIDWPDGGSFNATKGTQETRASFLIPLVNVEEIRTPAGVTSATLLPEDFPVSKVLPGMHDVVRVVQNLRPGSVQTDPPEDLTVMIPESTGLLNVRSNKGPVTLSDYHGTTIAVVGRGQVVFENVGGDAFVQPLNGHFYAVDSTFDRIRIRSNRADEVFDACRVKQIEATTLTGNIIFDDGVFNPGLARFESDRGSVALGVNGGAQIGAHSQAGQVYSALPAVPALPVIGRAEGESVLVAGNGGPLVNAGSVSGNVFLYDGSLSERRAAGLGPAWHPMSDSLLGSRAFGRRPAFLPVVRSRPAQPDQLRLRHWRAQPRPPVSQ